MRKWMKKPSVMMSTTLISVALAGCGETALPTPGAEESGYTVEFPVQRGCEQIDVLVRIRDAGRSHQLKLIFVERDEWSPARKARLHQIREGRPDEKGRSTAYPFRTRIRIDSIDADKPVHIDGVVAQRSPLYSRVSKNNHVTWRAQLLYALGAGPGIYRVRVDNLVALPEIDFQTLFRFERDNRKY